MPRYKVPLYRKDDPLSRPKVKYVTVRADTAELARAKAVKRRPKWFAGRSESCREVAERDKLMDFWLVLFVLFTALAS